MKKRILSLLLVLTLLLSSLPLSAQAAEPTGINRAYGSTRYETAFKAADLLKEQLGVSKFAAIVVADGTNFADALSGSYLAAVKDAPILLVRNNKTTMQQVKDYIKKNLVSGGTVYLLGGVNAVPKAMESGLEGFTVKRLGGNTRYDTNLLILKEAGVGDKDILVCTGKGFADSLSASAAERPILLVKDSFTSAQKDFLKDTKGKLYIIGGTSAVSAKVESALKAYGEVKRLGGNTRYETSVLVAEEFFENPTSVVLAYAQNFPDGLSGGALAAGMNAPLILTASGKDKAAVDYVKEAGVQGGFVLGGTTLISDKAVNNISGALKEPGDSEKPSGIQTFKGDFTYTDRVVQLSTNWNPHTYEDSTQAYPNDYLTAGFYRLAFNDELNPIKGMDPYEGYIFLPEMAASLPVDVTKAVKAAHPEFNIPGDAAEGFAYTIDLNPLATWEDGTPITADDYVASMERLLDPKLQNYRAEDYYNTGLSIAGAEAYANAGRTVIRENGITPVFTLDDLVADKNGNYTFGGEPVWIAVGHAIEWLGGNSLADYVNAYGGDYFGLEKWEALSGMMDEEGKVPCNDETLAMLASVTTTNPSWGETEAELLYYLLYGKTYPKASYDTVGLYKSGDYQITLVLSQALTGFDLLYELTGNWLVKTDLYDACLKEENGTWTSVYNTSVETTCSYGPYKLSSYLAHKGMHFVKNENWYGHTDGKHIYKDPEDGLLYPMYQTTEIDCMVVVEDDSARALFLRGELMQYDLRDEDLDTYHDSEFCYRIPGQVVYSMILNGHLSAIQERENADGFDKSKKDLEMLTLTSFRRALGLAYDKALFVESQFPDDSPAFGLIGSSYIYDPETGATYRDTDVAKKVLCEVYAVDPSKYASLDEAVASITGYAPAAAATFFKQAFNEGIAAGYINDVDANGICDQTIEITYAVSNYDYGFEKMLKRLNHLTEKANEAAKGTPFEGKIKFVPSTPLGAAWSEELKAGKVDTVLAGWTSSSMDPFGLAELYTNPVYQYDANWFDTTTVDMTLTLGGKQITLNLDEWTKVLEGIEIKGYNFGEGIGDPEDRLAILAGIEKNVLLTYNYLPMTEDGSLTLLSQKAYYFVENYNFVLGRGGIAYLRYNYNDTEWADYVASQPNGELTY